MISLISYQVRFFAKRLHAAPTESPYTRAKVKRYTENGRKPGVCRGYRARGGDNVRDGEIGSHRRPIRGRRVKTTATRQHKVASY